uniref:RRM domain-containing protein n=1 Tax=Chromera velia CCMP2878 TaxID=1169474 RepID=A0A0G4I161_9ALVE|eukprot:Cvel_9.t1-p1 / transcript=Cvel_9.t1 / gene=Cvel_9 / organism=Chromera_velia_CCMP2878 / gene_product=U2 small nuclear ribonucleoprotein B'' 2, putative / transcript_product=U2 small nuclear ribonucleoprotein B'' 2, putative / location=Cvel_scaffold5:55628-58588(+) / protein_length=351 / sequence_SO=supercontig / SO=protein_coding / is_pseudo=false
MPGGGAPRQGPGLIPPEVMQQMLLNMVQSGKGPLPGAGVGGGKPDDDFSGENQTLYVNNLNDRINPTKMKERLDSLFRQHGEVIDVQCSGTFWRKGQAWITFASVDQARRAMDSLNGVQLEGKEMRVRFAKSKADVVTKKEGTFVPREKKPRRPPGFKKQAADMLLRMATEVDRQRETEAAAAGPGPSGTQQPASGASAAANINGFAPPTKPDEDGVKRRKRFGGWDDQAPAENGTGPSGGFSGPPPTAQAPAAQTGFTSGPPKQAPLTSVPNYSVPSKTLFIEGIAPDTQEAALRSLFQGQQGFVDIRTIISRGVAFADFATEAMSSMAIQATNNARLGSGQIRVSFAKK